MCPTSNVQTKAVNQFREYPVLKFHRDGIKVTINTDNRTVSNTTMTKEIEILSDVLQLSEEEYRQIYINSVEASFADAETKKWCLAQLPEKLQPRL